MLVAALTSHLFITMNALSLLEAGIDSWNQWRSQHPNQAIDLSGQDLSHGYFFEGNFKGINLSGANLQRVCLIGADLAGADLAGADLTGAYLGDANLAGTNLSQAILTETNLDRADLRKTNLLGVNLSSADISAAQLPDPNADPYLDIVFELLAKQRASPSQPVSHASQPFEHPGKSTAYKTASYRQSLLRQMIDHLPAIARDSERAVAMRQQAIRQSAVLVTQTKRPPLRIATTTTAPAKRQPFSKNINAVDLQPSQTKKKPRNLARRQSDRRLSARINRQIQQQSGWAIAAGLLLAIGLPTGFYKLSEPPLSAQEIATSFALSRSLTGSSQVWAVATHPLGNGQSLVVGGGDNGEIEIWNSQTGELVQKMKGHQSAVKTLAMSQSGDWLVSGGQDGVKVWQPDTGELKYTLPDAQAAIRSVAISPNEQIFISSDRQGTISAWQLATGEKLYSIENKAPVWSVAIAPNAQTFVTGSSPTTPTASTQTQTLKQWDLASGQLVKTFDGHQGGRPLSCHQP